LIISPVAYAATSPSLGTASTYGILASTYTNTVTGTTITGDLGYTTGPAVAPTIIGNTEVSNSAYAQAGTDQASALAALNSQACTFTFASGAIDLATDTTHGSLGIYTPGVYCISGAASIGAAGISLNGSGVYIFRMSGTLTTTAASGMTLLGGASPTDLWWTPLAATTLGANSTFAGSDIDNAGINIGNLVTWSGNALAYGGTVLTSRDNIVGSSFNAPASGGGAGGSGSGSSSNNTSAGSNNSAPTSSNIPNAPDTGFGVVTRNPLQSLAGYIFASLILVLLAAFFRKTVKSYCD
jgi:hypothetical protein